MRKIVFIICIIMLSAIFASPSLAEVIKCVLPSGKVVYQSTPCSSKAVSQKKVAVEKQNQRQKEESLSKLKAWQAQQAAEEEAKIKAAKELQEQISRQEAINALNRNAIAQQQQAIAAQRQAEALERQRFGFGYPRLYAVPPPH